MRGLFFVLIVLSFISSANALVYYQQDWTDNGNFALIVDDANAPFDPKCVVGIGNRTAIILSPNYVMTAGHWGNLTNQTITHIGNKTYDANCGISLYEEGDSYNEVYKLIDSRRSTTPDLGVYRIKKVNPNDSLEDANFPMWISPYDKEDELGNDIIFAGFGPQRIWNVDILMTNSTYGEVATYTLPAGTLHWGYNQVNLVDNTGIRVAFGDNDSIPPVVNEIMGGIDDSGTPGIIYDLEKDEYKVAGCFGVVMLWGGPMPYVGGAYCSSRISQYLDWIAQNVSAMGTPTFADKLLGGLKQDVTVSYEIENDADQLNPVDPNCDELTITVTIDELSEFADGGADILTINIDVPDDFGTDMFDPNSGFGLHFLNNVYYCNIDLSQINPNNSITKTLTLHASHAAEPLSSAKILISTAIDNLTETSDTISCDIANWSDPCSQAGVVYVNDDAMVSTSGTSWAYPYKILQDAITRAIKPNSGIDKIWMATGTYTADEGESFSIAKDIEIYGGFVGSESDVNERSDVANKTILTVSDSLQNVFWLSTEDAQKNIVLDGLTITGSAQSGIYLRKNICDIRHCVITGNGAGIAGNNATLSMQDCVLTYNSMGLDMSFSGIAIDRSVFSFNEEAGIKLNSDGFFMVNSVVSENIDDGLNFVTPINTEILNCDIVNNGGYGLYGISGVATTRINNNIVYGNSSDAIPTGQYINNNVQSDPPFRFPYVQGSNYVKYQLSSDSNSCIDAGNTLLVGYYPLDMYGQNRVVDSVVDIGAVEFKDYLESDWNIDGIVNFRDYLELASVWFVDL